jgi:hypothetical protein
MTSEVSDSESSCPTQGSLRKAPFIREGNQQMQRTDYVVLLSIRLRALNGLLVEMCGYVADCLKNYPNVGAFLLDRSIDCPLILRSCESMVRALRCLGDKLAWLDRPPTNPLLPLEEVYRHEKLREEDPIEQYAGDPLTGSLVFDTFMAFSNILIQTDCWLERLMQDCTGSKFHNCSDYPHKDLSLVCAGLLLDTLALLKLSCELKSALHPGSESDAEAAITAYLEGPRRIEGEHVFFLYRFIESSRRST